MTAASLASCSGEPAVPVAVPDGPAAGCAQLHDVLPHSLGGRERRGTRPASDRTAAWGSAPVLLRCGTQRPQGLTRTSEVVVVDGVAWYVSEPAPAYVFTTVDRGTYVQVRVPRSVPRTAATGPLVDLAAAVKRTWRAR